MIRLVFALWLFAEPACFLSPDTAEKVFQEGVEQLQNREDSSAVRTFETLIQAGYDSPEVYTNLGNAYYRVNNPGKAVVAYKRALRRDPLNESSIRNLEKVASRDASIIPAPTLWQKFTGWVMALICRLTIDQWAGLFLVACFGVAISYGAMSLIQSGRIRSRLYALRIFIVCLGAVAVTGASVQHFYLYHPREAVMLKNNTAREAPSLEAKDQFPVAAGAFAEIADSFDGWIKIQFPDGQTGWVEAEAIEVI